MSVLRKVNIYLKPAIKAVPKSKLAIFRLIHEVIFISKYTKIAGILRQIHRKRTSILIFLDKQNIFQETVPKMIFKANFRNDGHGKIINYYIPRYTVFKKIEQLSYFLFYLNTNVCKFHTITHKNDLVNVRMKKLKII